MKNCGGGIEQLQQNNATITQAIERINTAIEALQNASTGAVRHIQRGELKAVASTYEYSISLSGFTNPDKMIAVIDGAMSGYSGAENMSLPRVSAITKDALTVKVNGLSTNSNLFTISYQVIEFY